MSSHIQGYLLSTLVQGRIKSRSVLLWQDRLESIAGLGGAEGMREEDARGAAGALFTNTGHCWNGAAQGNATESPRPTSVSSVGYPKL